jgi:hypothetical protein
MLLLQLLLLLLQLLLFLLQSLMLLLQQCFTVATPQMAERTDRAERAEDRGQRTEGADDRMLGCSDARMFVCLRAYVLGILEYRPWNCFFIYFGCGLNILTTPKDRISRDVGGPQHTPAHTTTPKPTQTHTNTLTRMCKNKKFVLFREIILLLFLNIHF